MKAWAWVWRWWVGLVLVLAGASLARPGVAQADAPHDILLADYWLLVKDTRTFLRLLPSIEAAVQRTTLDELATRWEEAATVRLPDRREVHLNTAPIVAELRADPPNYARLNALLENVEGVRKDWGLWPPRRNRDALLPLESILAGPEFQWSTAPAQTNPLEAWLNELWLRFLNWLDSLLPRGQIVLGIPVGQIITGVATLIVLALLVWVLRGILANFVTEARAGNQRLHDEDRLTAETALQRAQEVSSTGDYRTAVRYLYLSSLLLLEERGLLRYDRSLTNREYLRSLSQHPALRAILRDMTEVFDQVWYGYHTLDAEHYAHYAARVMELRQQK